VPDQLNLSKFTEFQAQARTAGIVFYHTGEFTGPIISAAAEALRHRMQESGASGASTRKLFSTFVEMAQNIHHYAAASPDLMHADTVGAGTISVIRGADEYWVICVNRIETAGIPRITEKLDQVRAMSLEEIKRAYKEQLKNLDADEQSKGAGLGWLTVARDSKQPLEYSFTSDTVGEGKYAHFLVKAVI
jgi:hypothetical protein